MGTLAKCIELSKIHSIDGDLLQSVAASYRKEGFKAQEANKNAVKDAIKEIEVERKSIIAQIKKAIAATPKKEAPKKKELDIGEIGNFDIPNLAGMFLPMLKVGKRLNKLDIQKAIAEKLGITRTNLIKDSKYSHKQIEEAFEYAIVQRARTIIKESSTVKDAYSALKKLHDTQPLLATRTSTSIKQQMYSTPVHLAYLAQVMGMANAGTTVYEPSGGTGMLVTVADPKKVTANEIDEKRIDILQDQGIKTLQGDGTTAVKSKRVAQKSARSVMANPPFGSIAPVKVDGYALSKIEHLMIADALGAMTDNGHAAFIIGGKNFEKGKMNSTQKVFLNWLYNHYYVKHNIDIPGKEYARQGATFPIRLITIDGRKKIARAAAPSKENEYQSITKIDELLTEGYIDGSLDAQRFDRVPVSKKADGGVRAEGGKDVGEKLPSVSRPEGIGITPEVKDVGREPSADIRRPSAEGISDKRPAGKPEGARPSRIDEPRLVGKPSDIVSDVVAEGKPGLPKKPARPEAGKGTVSKPGRVPEGVKKSDVQGLPGTDTGLKGVLETPAKEDSYQVTYAPKSKGNLVDEVLIPRAMAGAVSEALDNLETEIGNIDTYVQDKLKYKDSKALYKALSSDQIDAVALSINNIDKGFGMIVGSQTGTGKGRVAAAVMDYAKLLGKKPVFFTEKPNLFTDIYRDIVDIGRTFDPFIMASNPKLGAILGKDEKVVYPVPKPGLRKAMLRDLDNKGVDALGDYDSAVTTYSQISKKDNAAQRALSSLAEGNILILDESHNASGDSATGNFVRDILTKVDGVLYMSATFAKRPDTMPLYFKTALQSSNLSMDDLIRAIDSGGIPLQEIVSTALARRGQLIRNEKSFKGININSNFDVVNKSRDTGRADGLAKTLQGIVNFDKYVNKEISEIMQKVEGGDTSPIGNIIIPGSTIVGGKTVTASITTANFASTVHNAVRQSLLAMKIDMAANRAIEELKAGRKPIIALANTMGSFVKGQLESGALKEGGPFNLTMKDVMLRHLKRTLQIRVKSPQGESISYDFPVNALPPTLQEAYKKQQSDINNMAGGELSGNPIDHIRKRLLEAGYKVDELTGRQYAADFTDINNPVLAQRSAESKAQRNQLVSNFNNGELDCLIINSAGATGLSLHASPEFKDKRPRTYIGLQAEQNIDTEIQKMGRINRKGQIALPLYQMLFLDIPTEIRPAAILNRKLKSLSANTSAGADSPMAQKTLPDMLNKYGDTVTYDWLQENSHLAKSMGLKPGDDMVKVTGRLALQPVHVQNRFYDEIEQDYESLIETLKEEGRYDLEVGDVDFKAETTEKDILTQGNDESNPFGASTYRERLKVTLPDKPYNKKRIENIAKARIGNKTPDEISAELVSKIEVAKNKYLIAKKEEIADAEDFAKFEEHVNDSFTSVSKHLRFNKIGNTVQLDGARFGGPVGAAIIDIKVRIGAGNPAAPSNVKFVYALNNAMQKSVIPLSQINTTGAESVSQHGMPGQTWTDWDETVGADVQQSRYMITGNLLQGYADAPYGSRIVRYTTKAEGTKEGILLPVNYEVSAFEEDVRISQDQAAKMISEIATSIKSDSTKIDDRHDGTYSIHVPLSKSKGGKFFLDDKLLSIVEGEFESYAGQMTATVKKSEIPALIKRLYELGEVFKTGRDSFKAAFGEVKIEEPQFKKRTTTESKGKFKAAKLQGIVDKVATLWENAPDIKVVQSQSELPGGVNIYLAEGDIVDGVFHKGKVYIVADNQASIETTVVTLLHETLGHFGLRGSLGKDFTNVMNDVYISKKAEIDKIATEYGLDVKTPKGKAMAAEEWLAREAVANPKSGWVKRVIDAIRQFIRRIIPSLKLSNTEITQLLESARSFVEKGRQKAKEMEAAPKFAKRTADVAIDTTGYLPPIVEERMSKAKAPKTTFKEEASATLTKVKAQRHHFPDLQEIEDEGLRAKVNDILRRHQEVPETAKNETIRLIDSFTKDLSKDGYKIYRMNIFLADMMRDIRNGLTYDGKLPFGFNTTAEVESAYSKFQKTAKQHPEIAEALKRRSDAVNSLKERSVAAKILKKEVLNEKDYFHHQIIKYWQTKQKLVAGAKDVRTHWRPWMAARKGSMLDYNTDYIEAEYAAMSQQLEQVLTVETLQRIKEEANVYSQLKQEARVQNNKNLLDLLRKQGKLEKHPKTGKEKDPLAPWKQKIAMSNASLAKMANDRKLEYDSEWQGLVDQLAKSYEAWKNRSADSPDQPQPGVNDARWFDFLSYLINTDKPGANWAATILKSIRDRDAFIKDTLGSKFLTFENLVPEGYTDWKPDPNKGWFWANVVTDKILEGIQRGEIDPNDVETRKLLAKGSDIVWVIPEGLAKTLDNFRGRSEEAWVGHVADTAMRAWKQYILLNPYSVLRYNLNNASGDLDAAIAYEPKIATKYAWQAFKDLRKWHNRKKLDPETQKQIDFAQASGAIQSGFAMQETEDVYKALRSDKVVRDILSDEQPNWFTKTEWFGLKTIGSKYWQFVKKVTAMRENVLRLSAYRFFLDNKDKRLYGASKPTEVNAITDPKERAAKLARELFGDYGNISKSGEYIRKRLMPFYSWLEINAPRYVYLMRNTKYENRDVDSVKKQMAAVAGKKLILSGAKMALRASMLMGAVMLWNMTMFPDEEEELGESGRRQLHIILGRREDGSIITLRFQGALSDALSFFGLEDWPADMKDLLDGKRTVGEKLKEVPLALLNRGVQAIRPEPKMLGEVISGKKFYPDVMRPMPIRDRMEHVLSTFKLDKMYRAALGRPGRYKTPGASKEQQAIEHFMGDFRSLLLYESDPGLLAYYDSRGMVFDWLAKQGDEKRFGGKPTKKGNAFYYYKQAMKFGDLDAAQRYLKKYYDLGGTRRSHMTSIKYAHPLASLPKLKRNIFRQSLDARQEARLKSALDWYGKTYR